MNDTKTDRILMAHQVAGYPTDELCIEAGKALIEGGAKILEVQLPFSDPSADGTAIQTACSNVLSRGYTVEDGFSYIRKMHGLYPEIPLFIMTYGSLAYRNTVENFVKRAKEAGVSGLIIPDLPFDYDEGLGEACKKYGIEKVPVAAPSMTEERIKKMTDGKFNYIYAALRAGITGSSTTIDEKILSFIKKLSVNNTKILGGFGIQNGEQAEKLAPHVYAVVAGSVFVKIITETYENGKEAMRDALIKKARELSGK